MTKFCYPVLPLRDYVVWEGGGFLDPIYLREEKSQHPGADFNGRGGGDTDLGAPVYAIADGVVNHAQDHRVWGNVVTIDHDGEAESQYAHLHKMMVREGQRVHMGQQIGTIGKGGVSRAFPNGRYRAHLHFEIRKTRVPADEWPSVSMSPSRAAEYIRRTRVDPVLFLQRAGALDKLPVASSTQRPTPAPPPDAVPGTHYLYGRCRVPYPKGQLVQEPAYRWASVATDAQGRVLLGPDGLARVVLFDDERAAKKGLVK